MTEIEYITAGNLARLRAAETIISKVIPDVGVSKKELREIINILEAITDRITREIKIEEEGVK